MAGYTSTPRQYGEYIQPFNIDMIAKGLSYKENKNDAADAQLRERINQIGSLDIIKDQDKSYLLSRLTSMVGDVNNVGALDLSDAGIVKNLDSHIQNSIDENVLNAFQSTRQIRAFQENLRDIQKKQKDLYNPLNEAYAMRPVQKYLSSDKVGENVGDYGALVYTPFTDIEGEINKQMSDYVKNMKDGRIKILSEDGRSVYERDVRGMNPNEIKNMIGSMVSSKYNQQAAINSWARYDKYSPEGVARYQSDVNRFVQVKNNDYDNSITKLEMDANSVKDKGQDYSGIENQIKNLRLEKDSLGSQREAMLKNPEAYGAIIEKEGIVTNLTTRFTPLLKSLPDSFVGKNEVYYAEQENQFKQLKYEIDLQQLDLAKQKNRREEEEFRLKASGQWKGSGNGSSSDSSSSGGNKPEKFDGIGIGTLETAPQKERDWEQETVDLISSKDKTIQQMTKQTFDYVSREAKSGNKGAIALIKDYDLKRKGKHSGYLFRQLYNTQASNLGLNLVEDPNGNQIFTMGDLSAEVEEYNTVSNNYKNIRKNILDNSFNQNINGADFYKNMDSEKNLMVATPEGLFNLRDLAIRSGAMNQQGQKLKNVTDIPVLKNTIKANLILGNTVLRNGGLASKRPNVRAFDRHELYDLGNIYGENLLAITNERGEVSLSNLRAKAPKTFSALMNYEKDANIVHNSNFSYSRHNLGSNQRVIQDSVFRNLSREGLLDNKVIREKYMQDLMSNLQGVGVDNAIVMSNPKDANFQRFAQQISAFGRPGDGTSKELFNNISTDNIKEIKYRLKQENGEMRVQFKVQLPKQGVSNHEVFLNVRDLQRNAPDFMSAIDFQEKNFYYSRKGMGNKAVKTSSDGISFVNPSSNFIYNSKLQTSLQSEFGNLPFYNAIISGINKDDTRRYLYNQFKFENGNSGLYKDILTNTALNSQQKQDAIKQQEQVYLGAVDNLINNSNNFVLDAGFINDNQYALQLKDKSGRSVAGIVQNGDNLKPLKKLFDNYESSAYTMFVSGLIEQEKANIADGASGFTSSFKKLTGL